MYRSAATELAATQWQATHPNLYAFLFGATVQFYGTASTGDAFNATGVIVQATAQYADVVTAKHNLFIAARDEADRVAYYCEHIRVRSYSGGAQIVAAIESIRVLDDGPLVNQGLDIMVVRVRDRNFVAAARALIAAGGPGEQFRTNVQAELDAGWIIRPTREEPGRAVVTNGHPYEGVTTPGAANFTLVHMGYGLVQGDRAGYAFRAMPAATLGAPTIVDHTHDGWNGIFTYGATPADTGMPGDSGSPIFAVSPPIVPAAPPGAPAPAPAAPGAPAAPAPAIHSVALVGIHSGANYFADAAQDRPDRPTVNNAMTLATRERLM